MNRFAAKDKAPGQESRESSIKKPRHSPSREHTALASLGRYALEGLENVALFNKALASALELMEAPMALVEEHFPGGGRAIAASAGLSFAPGEPAGGESASSPCAVQSPAGLMESSRRGKPEDESIERNQPMAWGDFQKSNQQNDFQRFIEQGAVSGACVPIQGEARLFGVLWVLDRRRRRFTLNQLNLLQTIADFLSASLRQRRAEMVRNVFSRMAVRLAGCAAVEAMILVIREESDALLGWDAHYFAIRRPGEDLFRVVNFVDTINGRKEIFPVWNWSSSKMTSPLSALLDGQNVLINRMPENENISLDPFGDTSRLSASLIHVPVCCGGRIIGIISCQSYTRNRYQQADAALLRQFADIAAPALARAFTEESAKEREELYRLLFRQSPIGVLYYDLNLRITECNERLLEILQVTRERMVGFDIREIRDKGPLEAILKPLEGKSGLYEGFYQATFSAAQLWVSLKASPIRDARGVIKGAIALIEDVTERKSAEEALHHTTEALRAMTVVDDLTGLYNRRGFVAFAEQHLRLAQRMGRSVVLLFGDMNGLKTINDSFGHAAGDHALAELAKIMRQTFRESDILARLGGDEFVVLALETVEADGAALIERLRQNIEIFNSRHKKPWSLGMSIGMARYSPDSPCSLGEMLRRADMQMYEGKWGLASMEI